MQDEIFDREFSDEAEKWLTVFFWRRQKNLSNASAPICHIYVAEIDHAPKTNKGRPVTD